MQLPADYKITAAQKIYIFRMFEGGCKSTFSAVDYANVVRSLFLAICDCEPREIAIERLPELLQAKPDFNSYDALAKLGTQRLREIAAKEKERVSSWFSQEAGILEIKD